MKIPGRWIVRHEVNPTDFEVDDPPQNFNSMDIPPPEGTGLHVSEAKILAYISIKTDHNSLFFNKLK